MANIVKFKINGLTSALSNVYTRVTDLSRNELYSGETLVSDTLGNVKLDIGTAGSDGQGVIVYGDNYFTGNESSFKSFCGYGVIGLDPNKITVRQHLSIATLGASVIYGAFDELYAVNAEATEQLFSDNGVRIKIIPFAVGGNQSASTLLAAPNAISALNSRGGYKLGVLHTGGNDITSAWQGYPTSAAEIASNINGIFDLFDAESIPVTASPISYRVPPASNPVEQYNANDVEPILDVRSQPWRSASTKFDLYALLFANQQYLAVDGIHPDAEGNVAIQNMLMGNILSTINYAPPPDTAGIQNVIIRFGIDGYRKTWLGLRRNQVTAHSTQYEIYNKDLTKVVDGYISVGFVDFDSSGLSIATNYELTLSNPAVVKEFCYTQTSALISFTANCFDPSATYTVRLTGCRATTATNRVGLYTVGGVSKTMDAAVQAIVDQEIIEFTNVLGSSLIADGILFAPDVGSTIAYVGGIEIIKD